MSNALGTQTKYMTQDVNSLKRFFAADARSKLNKVIKAQNRLWSSPTAKMNNANRLSKIEN